MEIIENLKWRYATKRMTGESVSEDLIDKIMEAARWAPTSSGLQPFRIIVVSSAETKEKIKPIAFNQPQITECSHLLIFAAFDEYTAERIDDVFAQQEEERGLPQGTTDDYKNQLKQNFSVQSKDEHFNHAARQAYIGLGMALAAAAELRVDSTPMEGFNNADLDELLRLTKKGLKSVALLPLGKRDTEQDWLVNLKKVRTEKNDFIIHFD